MKSAHRSEKARPRSEAQRLLRIAGTIAEIAAETGLSTRSVSSYRSGSAEPGDDARAKIAAAYPQIPPSAWSRAPVTFHEPDWLGDAVGTLIDAGLWAAAEALRRQLIVESGDVDELREHDEIAAAYRARRPELAELEQAALAAEAAYSAAVDAIEKPAPVAA
jgi:hypothetical protein